MSLTSLSFIAFVLLLCLFYYMAPKKLQWILLLIASLAFFFLSSGFLTIYMIVTAFLVYAGAIWIGNIASAFEKVKETLDKPLRREAKKKYKAKQKRVLAGVAIIALGILIILKYGNLGVEIVNGVSSIFHTGPLLNHFKIILPLGISYYSLMAVSYVTDVYRGIVKAEKNPFRVLLFVCYFPHITVGPFDRYKDLDEQFRTVHHFDWNGFCEGFFLILYGFFKKIMIADRISMTISPLFDHTNAYSGSTILFASILYTFQLYCDFSGCIDIVSGVSGLFGIKVANNFRQPFFSKSINEFWKRWHISLGAFLKDYVYYPVVLSGHFKAVDRFVKKHLKSQHLTNFLPVAYALFFVWFTNGLWHGASIKYILYGLYYYVLMMLGVFFEPVFEKLKTSLHIQNNQKLFSAFQVLRTFLIVNIGMLLFRSQSIREFVVFLKRMATSINAKEVFVLIWNDKFPFIIIFLSLLTIGFISLIMEHKPQKTFGELVYSIPFAVRYILLIVVILSLVFFGVYGPGFDASDFVYAQF